VNTEHLLVAAKKSNYSMRLVLTMLQNVRTQIGRLHQVTKHGRWSILVHGCCCYKNACATAASVPSTLSDTLRSLAAG